MIPHALQSPDQARPSAVRPRARANSQVFQPRASGNLIDGGGEGGQTVCGRTRGTPADVCCRP